MRRNKAQCFEHQHLIAECTQINTTITLLNSVFIPLLFLLRSVTQKRSAIVQFNNNTKTNAQRQKINKLIETSKKTEKKTLDDQIIFIFTHACVL